MPGLLAASTVAVKFYDNKSVRIVAVAAPILLAVHAFFTARVAKSKLDNIKYWENELQNHKWLLIALRAMVQRKLDKVRDDDVPLGEIEYRDAIIKNLTALREFYTHFASDPDNHFRIVFFLPDESGAYLVPKFYATSDGTPPHSYNDPNRQREIFHRERSQTVTVSVWKDGVTKIIESEEELQYTHPQQRNIIKSMIAYPVFLHDKSGNRLLGIISITSSVKGFFKRQDQKRHENYISQFALRLEFEYCKWHAQQQK